MWLGKSLSEGHILKGYAVQLLWQYRSVKAITYRGWEINLGIGLYRREFPIKGQRSWMKATNIPKIRNHPPPMDDQESGHPKTVREKRHTLLGDANF